MWGSQVEGRRKNQAGRTTASSHRISAVGVGGDSIDDGLPLRVTAPERSYVYSRLDPGLQHPKELQVEI